MNKYQNAVTGGGAVSAKLRRMRSRRDRESQNGGIQDLVTSGKGGRPQGKALRGGGTYDGAELGPSKKKARKKEKLWDPEQLFE